MTDQEPASTDPTGLEDYRPANRSSELMADQRYLEERVRTKEVELSSLSSLNQKKYKRLKKAEIIIAATIPLAVTLSSIEEVSSNAVIESFFTIYAGIGGAILALMNNILKMGGFFDKWKEYRSRAELLKREEFLYLTQMPPYDVSDAFPAFVDRVEQILKDPEEEKPNNDG